MKKPILIILAFAGHFATAQTTTYVLQYLNGSNSLPSGSVTTSQINLSTAIKNLLDISNPGADRYFKFNADNTFTLRSAAEMLSDIGAQASGSYATGTGTANGTNTGDQTSIVGITGTFAQFNTAVTDADFARSDAANTFTGVQTFSSAPVFSTGTATVGGNTITFPVVAATLLPNTTTSGVGSSPTSSSTQTITHNLGRIPTIIRIYGAGTFTSNAAATATTFTMGTFNSTGNRCVYQGYNTAAITTTQASATSATFAIALYTGANNFVTGVIQNVTSTQFDIVWTETGTATAQNYLWEAQ